MNPAVVYPGIYAVHVILSASMTSLGVVRPLPWPEPSTLDSGSNNNLDINCVRVLVIRMPDSARYLSYKIREL